MFFFRDFSNTFSDGAVVFPQHNFIIRTFNGNLLSIARVCQEIEMIFGDDEIGIISGVSTDVADVLFFCQKESIHIMLFHIFQQSVY